MGTPDLSPEIVTKLKDQKGEERSVGFISSDGIVALLEDDQISWVKKVILNTPNFTEFFLPTIFHFSWNIVCLPSTN